MNKKKIYEKLGASWFQDVVFNVEKLKFAFIDRFCPNIGTLVDKYCNYNMQKKLKKCNDEEQRNAIIFDYNCRKLSFKREMVEKKNKNYHIDYNNASDFYKYLVWNKNVHMKGLFKDIICVSMCLALFNFLNGFWLGVSWFCFIYNIISLGVDFQCVNLQNYNMCRFKEKESVLTKLEMRKRKKDIEKYSNVSVKVYDKLSKEINLPDDRELVNSLDSLQELSELRNLVLEIKRKRHDNNQDLDSGIKIKIK